MNDKIIDGMKKEGKPFKYVMIFGYVFAILMLLSNYFIFDVKYSDADILKIFIICLMVGTFGLYGWLYALTYKVEFNDDKVYLRTLFKKIELNIIDIEKYTVKRYRKSVFYQFHLFINGKKILINTRYKDEFENILKSKGISQ